MDSILEYSKANLKMVTFILCITTSNTIGKKLLLNKLQLNKCLRDRMVAFHASVSG